MTGWFLLAICSILVNLSSDINSGIMRVPATVVPSLQTVLLCTVAMIISPSKFISSSAVTFILIRPAEVVYIDSPLTWK